MKYLVDACENVEIKSWKVVQIKNFDGDWEIKVQVVMVSLDDVGGELIQQVHPPGTTKVIATVTNRKTYAQLYTYRDQIMQEIGKILINAKIDYAGISEADLRTEFGDTIVDEVLAERT